MKINKPIPKLTHENLERIIYNYPIQYKLGFTLNEVRELLKRNKIKEEDFRKGMFGKTYAVLNEYQNKVVFYHRDIYNVLKGLI